MIIRLTGYQDGDFQVVIEATEKDDIVVVSTTFKYLLVTLKEVKNGKD